MHCQGSLRTEFKPRDDLLVARGLAVTSVSIRPDSRSSDQWRLSGDADQGFLLDGPNMGKRARAKSALQSQSRQQQAARAEPAPN